MAGYRVLDIETVPDLRYWTKGPTKWRQEPYFNVDPLTSRLAPNLFGEKTGTVLVSEEPFPPPQAHRVVAMAWVNLSGDDGRYYAFESSHVSCAWSKGSDADADVDADVTELSLLEYFGEEQSRDEATLVTWNGRTFDLPVINLRSFLHGLPCEWYYKERDTRYRYTEAAHCDLMDFFSDYGAARSMKLGDVARLAGLPGKFGEVSGGNVAEVVAHSADQPEAMRRVGEYCFADALQTAVLFAKSRVHKGMISRDFYDTVVAPSFEVPLRTITEKAKQS
jgi:predicted PolB exonuclease-like 3'-5' exonuclease